MIVLCSGWTNEQQPGQPKKDPFRDAILPVVIARSGDGGRSWIQSGGFPSAEEGWTEYIPFGPIVLDDKDVLHASCYSAPLDRNSLILPRHRTWHFVSHDDGRTWRRNSVLAPRHGEVSLLNLNGNKWLAAARLNNPGIMELFYSGDSGASWQERGPVTNRREINGHLLRLKDGRVLLTYGNRLPDQKGVEAKFSSDEGKTWSSPIRLVRLGLDCGYPSSVQRADGKIVTAYYSSRVDYHWRWHMGVSIWEAP